MKKYSYIEPLIRTIVGAYVLTCALLAVYYPDSVALWIAMLFFLGINLFQSGLSRFCIMEKALKRFGFRSEMDEIRSLALHDVLTELPNRLNFEKKIDLAIYRAKRSGKKVGILFIDLDNFKQINDSHGHKVGDQILIQVGQTLNSILRKSDTLARWGGDEFVVLLPEIESNEKARDVADKLLESMQKEIVVGEFSMAVTLSIGLAVFPDDADSSEALLVQSDKALFYSKSQGRNNVQVYSDMRANNLGYGDFKLTSKFTTAVKHEKLQVFYQPIFDAKSRQPVALEALARLYDPSLGWISPATFIPLAENLGLIHKVGQQVIEQAISYHQSEGAHRNTQLSINVSNRQLFSRSFVPYLHSLLEKYRISPSRLKFEITESIALDSNRAQRTLRQLTSLGYSISLDDFGTGFSSLSRLHELRADELKIDISFVRRIKTENGKIMLQSIIDMGHAMNLSLVAEGVEDEETALLLMKMGVEKLQGNYLSPPMNQEACRKFMSECNNKLKTLSKHGIRSIKALH